MPDQVVILFMFAVVTSFGIIWLANEMRLKFQARYLEYCFYFTLVVVAYGFVNWIAPFAAGQTLFAFPYVPGVIGQKKATVAQ